MERIIRHLGSRKSDYSRLNRSGGRRRRVAVVLGSSVKRRRFWRVRPKLGILKLVASSPKRFFAWLRDAYVKMMMRLAESPMMTMGPNYGGGDGFGGQGKRPLKEYDERMIVEIYKTLVASQGLVVVPPPPSDAAGKLPSRLSAVKE